MNMNHLLTLIQNFKSHLDNGITLLGDYISCDKKRFLNKIQNSNDLQYWLSNQSLLKPITNQNVGMIATLGSICLSEYLEQNSIISGDKEV